ncbi:carbon-nitrogen hydrolase family protein [Brevibacillus dissolubilis]|uniref:carbon-nitrogen hydrolase family protein n=1 Tax=Brevibacillus dissolubilis TaxID=1844116 RepID=UPI001116FACA|nr:carbon-nitrogen hydrolase family protein [Brevibacillus dissolubilis]
MKIVLASARYPRSLREGIDNAVRLIRQAGEQQGEIICFPEGYLPGLRGQGYEVEPYDHQAQTEALEEIRSAAQQCGIAVIMGMEWQTSLGIHVGSFVISEKGEVLGFQAKNQIAPEEEAYYVPDGVRRVFTVKDLTFGITICHEGWRYPETVRWAAVRGAQIVFHPQMTGSDTSGPTLTEWGHPASPYYEKAMLCRSIENHIYFASVNYALKYQDSATSLISPEGECMAYMPYGEEGLLIYDIDPSQATGFLAKRYKPELYQEG